MGDVQETKANLQNAGLIPKRQYLRSSLAQVPDEHHQWAIEHWVRMDRDHDGMISRPELDSEEFRRALRACLGAARKSLAGPSDFSRSRLNVEQAIDFVRRKADHNADTTISFHEFESFTKSIRYGNTKSNADLIFALFDLDGDGAIDQSEFREIYRYYLGRMPTESEFQEEWSRLDMYGMQEVTKRVYMRWLQTSPNPIFHRHAPPPPEARKSLGGNATMSCPIHKFTVSSPQMVTLSEGDDGDKMFNDGGNSNRSFQGESPLPEGRRKPVLKFEQPDAFGVKLQKEQDAYYGGGFKDHGDRAEWNKRHHLSSWDNPGKPIAQRAYFSRPQSLPELTRFYHTHRSFHSHAHRMAQPEPKRRPRVLSNETKENPVPDRDIPDGMMTSKATGEYVLWDDHWQAPAWQRCRYVPGSMGLRLPGDATKILYES